MVRKITKEAVYAFNRGRKFKRDNTEVRVFENTGLGGCIVITEMRLHGNVIAWKGDSPATLMISSGRWPTITTKERLNGLIQTLDHRTLGSGIRPKIVQRDFSWYIQIGYDKKGWDGEPVNLSDFCASI